MHRPRSIARAIAAVLVGAVLVGVVAGCGAAGVDEPPPSPSPSAVSAPSIPPDGIALAAYGFTNGPVTIFSLPRTARLTAAVDQPNNVTAVLSAPTPADVQTYLRTALPDAGFTITQDDQAQTTLTFTGHDWSGSFTGTGGTSAVLLRPR